MLLVYAYNRTVLSIPSCAEKPKAPKAKTTQETRPIFERASVDIADTRAECARIGEYPRVRCATAVDRRRCRCCSQGCSAALSARIVTSRNGTQRCCHSTSLQPLVRIRCVMSHSYARTMLIVADVILHVVASMDCSAALLSFVRDSTVTNYCDNHQ